MKQLYFFLCLLFTTNLFAQDITSDVDNKLQLLNKNNITTDILYDRVFPLANLIEFNQLSSDTSHVNHFYQAYHELQRADYSIRWNPIQTLKTNVETEITSIPIGIINVDFEYMDEESISDNLLDIQGQDSLLVDVPNRSRSPYIKTKALVISTLATDTKSKSVNFKLDNSFNIVASNISIQSVEADFDNGQGYQSLSLSGQKSVTFNTTGLHTLKFKVSLSNGNVKYTYAKIRVNSSAPNTKISENITKSRTTAEFCYNDTITASRSFQGYDESVAYNGVGAFSVYLGGTAYNQPVIVLDGFDPFEGTDEGVDVEEIYEDFLRYGSLNLGDQLANQDFDIIPLNFINGEQNDGTVTNGGTDYVERNAMVLVELIERINNSSCWSNVQPIKVIGFSMGGLIGRYALRYMEQNNIPHNTDLFVSVDTPHNGAVVPTGLQEAADFIEDIASIDIGDKILKSPAAKQMLVHHYLANSKTPAGAPNFHDRFYNTLNTMGFPQQTRNIAVSNGIPTGTAINAPNQNYFNGEIETGANFPIIGIGADAKMKFSPGRNQTNKVFDFKAKIRFLAFYITVYRRFQEVTTNTNLGSYENSPGGFFTVEDEINQFLGADGVFNTNENLLTAFIYQARAEISTPRFSFIPVKSSLAFTGNNQDLYEDFSTRNLVCTGETPFDSYFTASNDNEQHIALNPENADFIFDEITGVQRSPNIQINPNEQINGPEVICSTIVTYNLANCAANTNNWTVSSNLEIINQTGSYITVRPIDGSSSAAGYIQANFSSNGNTRKNIFIGKPSVQISLLDSNAPYYEAWAYINGNAASLSLQGLNGKPTYSEVYHSGSYASVIIQGPYGNGEYKVIGRGSDNNWYKTIDIYIENNCGVTVRRVNLTPPAEEPCNYSLQSTGSNSYAFIAPPQPCGNRYASSEQSSDTSKKSKETNLKTSKPLKESFNIKAFDFQGIVRLESNNKFIDLSDLSSGIYVLKGNWNGIEYTKKVLKK